MGLAPGTKLGPYEVVSPLGVGGMGEVYRSRDTRLGRDVAIKILPKEMSADAARKQRFEREAKTISALNHPNICVLHDVGSQDGLDYLVMECLEGETLARRLEKGALPLEQVLKYGAQIADALDKAHRAGIVHRDLKPGNIMLTAVGAKLLDFGLAKPTAVLTEATTSAATPLHSPMTQEGTVVGTFQYMSPEQVEGKEIDGRSDIFSLGAVLYEMLTGKRAFEGKSQLSVASAILEKEPAVISVVKPMTPPVLDHTIGKCLAKTPDERWQSASDVASELKWILTAGSQAASAVHGVSHRKYRERAIWIVGVAVLALLAAYLGWQGGRGEPSAGAVHLTIALPAGKVLLNSSSEPMAITPDGSAIVYAAAGDDRKTQLYLRKVDSFESTPIGGTEEGSSPFISPRGEWLGFFTGDGKMKKVLLRGGSPVVLADAAFLGGSWGDDDTVYFTKSVTSGIYAVPAGGGQPRQVTHTGATADDRFHLWPKTLPGNYGIIFTVWTGRSFNDARIEGLLFKTGERKVLVEGGTDGRYLPNGYLAYTRNGTLFAVPFDPKRLEVKGAPMSLIEGVMSGAANGDADFAVSNNGTLVFRPGSVTSFQRNLVWMDRTGKTSNIIAEVKPYASPAISPDGQRIALTLQGSSFDVWVYDLQRGALTKASFGGDDYRPEWSPDGKMLGYDSSKSGHQQVYVKHGIAQGGETVVTDGPEDKQFCGWTPDGHEMIFSRLNKDTGWDLYAAAVEGDRKVRPLVVAPFNQNQARLSPDGKWLAYVSDESGQPEVFLQAMNDATNRAQVSTEGGASPRWTRVGNELLFTSKTRIMSVKLAGNGLNLGKPVALFEDKRAWNGYDIAADGRLVVSQDVDEAGGTQISVVLNWFGEMKKK
jgi:Tol biopolymer transport system component